MIKARDREKDREATRAWKAANPDKVKAYSKTYYEDNKERIAAAGATYYAAHKEEKKAYSATHYAANKEKLKAYSATYYAANKEKKKAYRAANLDRRLAYNRLRKTGVTQEQYDGAYLKQKGVCAICSGVEASGRRLAADHCHTTGVFRGLLCMKCNTGLGKFKDNTDLLTKAIGYLNDTENV